MNTFFRKHLLRKPSLFLVFLFFFAAAHAEIPEHIRLNDDISNDFTLSACGAQSVQPRTVSADSAPTSSSKPVGVHPAPAMREFQRPSGAEPFHLSDRLLLWSIQRT